MVVLVATSCSGGDKRPAIGQILQNPKPAEITLPLDVYTLSVGEHMAFMNARDRLIRECMDAAGFELRAVERVPPGQPDNARRYGLIDIDHARILGYQPPPESPAEQAAFAALMELERSITPAAKRALTGGTRTDVDGTSRVGGCTGAALAELQATDWSVENASVEELSSESHARSEQDPRVQDAFDGWSDCMAAVGFQYRDPWEANDDPQWASSEDQTSGTARVTDLQIATAIADVECKHDVNLAGIWLAVETAYQLELIADNEERLGQIKRHRDEVLRAAAEVE